MRWGMTKGTVCANAENFIDSTLLARLTKIDPMKPVLGDFPWLVLIFLLAQRPFVVTRHEYCHCLCIQIMVEK